MQIAMLSGGVGGAKLARGAEHTDDLDATVVVNIADDEQIYGFALSPDLDTVVYTMAGVHGDQGWGRSGDTWRVMDELASFGRDTSFRLGDADLALNLHRTLRLAEGATLSEVTDEISRRFGLRSSIVPASNDRVRTRILIDGVGWVDFQTYFVTRRHADPIADLRFEGIETARPVPAAIDAIAAADVVIIGPSNPVLSIWPILGIDGYRDALRNARRVVAVSPLVGGRAIKGPAVEAMASRGLTPDNAGIVEAYDGLVTDLVVHMDDQAPSGVDVHRTDIRVPDLSSSIRLMKEILTWVR